MSMALFNHLPDVDNLEAIRVTDDAVDRITSLPHDVIDIILCQLPFCEALRTSILCHGWRYKWMSMSSLVCDRSGFDRDLVTLPEMAPTIDRFLRNHRGTGIKRFEIKAVFDWMYSGIGQWMGLLAQEGVKEFVLEEWDFNCFPIPPSLFAFEHLRLLHLRRCSLLLSGTFEKFNFLTDLYLSKVHMTEEGIECLTRTCSNLERITLFSLRGPKQARIYGPALKCLSIDNGCPGTVLLDAPYLTTVDMTCSPKPRRPLGLLYWVNFYRSLSCAVSLKKLRFSGELLQQCASVIPYVQIQSNNLPAMFFDDVVLDNTEVLRLCSFLLYSFPSTERFYFSVKQAKGYRALLPFFCEAKQSMKPFHNLKMVTMTYSNPVGAAADFLNFVVERSPLIETVTIIKEGQSKQADKTVEKIAKKLRQSAPNVTVVFKAEDSKGGQLANRRRKREEEEDEYKLFCKAFLSSDRCL